MDDGHEPTKLFVGQIPKDISEDILKHYFDEFGPISEVSIIRDNNSMMSKGCAFVTFLYAQSAQLAINTLHDKVKLPNSHNLLQVRLAETHVERENKLFIGMLPKTVTELDLHNMFHFYGELREVHIIRGPEGSPKGCAFVKFVDREAAIAAIEDLHDTIPMGATRPLVVKFADGKKNQAGKGYDYWNAPPALSINNFSRSQPPPPPATLQVPQQMRPIYSQFPVTMSQLPHQQMVGMSFINSAGPLPPGSPGAPPQSPNMALQQQLPHQQLSHQLQQPPPQSQQRPIYTTTPPDDFYQQPQQTAPYSSMSPNALSYVPSQQREMPQRDLNFHSNGVNRSSSISGGGTIPLGVSGMPQNPAPYTVGRDQQPRFANYHQYGTQETMHARPPEGPSGANLFIYHLPRDLTDADLATLFAPFGNVISAKVFVDRKTADSKGFGFVSYDTLESANAAIDSMNGFQIGSKRLKVQHKRVTSGPSPQQGNFYNYSNVVIPQYDEFVPNRMLAEDEIAGAFNMMNLSGAPAASGSFVDPGQPSHFFGGMAHGGTVPDNEHDFRQENRLENEGFASTPHFPPTSVPGESAMSGNIVDPSQPSGLSGAIAHGGPVSDNEHDFRQENRFENEGFASTPHFPPTSVPGGNPDQYGMDRKVHNGFASGDGDFSIGAQPVENEIHSSIHDASEK